MPLSAYVGRPAGGVRFSCLDRLCLQSLTEAGGATPASLTSQPPSATDLLCRQPILTQCCACFTAFCHTGTSDEQACWHTWQTSCTKKGHPQKRSQVAGPRWDAFPALLLVCWCGLPSTRLHWRLCPHCVDFRHGGDGVGWPHMQGCPSSWLCEYTIIIILL